MQEKKLEMYGGLFGGLIPLIVLVGGLVWLSVAERGGTKPFWACAWIALCVGIFFAKDKEEYCKAAMRGIGDRTGIVIVGVTILASIPISANAPAELLVGPSIVRPLGERFGLAAARRANLMDCAVCTIFFVLPWHIAVAAWYGALYSAAETYAIPAPPISAALYNPYSWALLAVLLFSAFTGWNRKYAKDEAPAA